MITGDKARFVSASLGDGGGLASHLLRRRGAERAPSQRINPRRSTHKATPLTGEQLQNFSYSTPSPVRLFHSTSANFQIVSLLFGSCLPCLCFPSLGRHFIKCGKHDVCEGKRRCDYTSVCFNLEDTR